MFLLFCLIFLFEVSTFHVSTKVLPLQCISKVLKSFDCYIVPVPGQRPLTKQRHFHACPILVFTCMHGCMVMYNPHKNYQICISSAKWVQCAKERYFGWCFWRQRANPTIFISLSSNSFSFFCYIRQAGCLKHIWHVLVVYFHLHQLAFWRFSLLMQIMTRKFRTIKHQKTSPTGEVWSTFYSLLLW